MVAVVGQWLWYRYHLDTVLEPKCCGISIAERERVSSWIGDAGEQLQVITRGRMSSVVKPGRVVRVDVSRIG